MNRKLLLTIVVWLMAGGLLWLTMRNMSLTAVFYTLQQFQLWQFVSLTLLNGIIVLSLTTRWWLILWGLGYKVPFLMTIGHRLASFGVSYFTPGPQFGGEVVQVLLVEKRHAVPRATAVSSVALDKSIELLINFSFLLAGILIILQSSIMATRTGLDTAVSALLLLTIPLLYLTAIWSGYHPLTRFVRFFRILFDHRPSWTRLYETTVSGLANSERQAGKFCRHSPRFLLAAIVVSIIGWAIMIIEFGVMLTFLGADLPILQIIMVLTAVRIAFLLPSPGGLGTVEAALLLTLPQFNINPTIGLSASILLHGRDVLLGLIGLWWGKRFLKRST